MNKIIATNEAPEAIGPYSQAIETDNMIFCSGQIALKPGTTELISESIEQQTEQVLENLEAVLRAGGYNLENVVKTTIYLTDLNNFTIVNGIYAKYFGDYMPARATVEVSGLPKNALIEIDCIAKK